MRAGATLPDMRGTPLLHHTRCTAFQHLGRHEEAIAACEKALSLEDNWFFRMRLMASYALKDDMDKARALKEEVLAVFLDQRERHVFAGLRKSGIAD